MDFSSNSKILVTCHRGLAPWVKKEVVDLGYQVLGEFPTGVELQGTLRDCMRLNLRLRCASQVMFSLKRFGCEDPEDLYREVHRLPWEGILAADGYFSVNNYTSHPTVRSTMFPNVKIKDAIVDRLREKKQRRPDCGSELLGAVVYLYWQGPYAELFLDTSGPSLAKHGYRKHPGKAPMMEALAAGTILATRWDQAQPFVNPMCGSGTIAIEAALIKSRRVPGVLRQRFAFEHLIGFDQEYLDAEVSAVRAEVDFSSARNIFASDIDANSVAVARANAAAAGVEHMIQFDICDFQETPLPEQRPMVVMLNPEYGERLGSEEELDPTYSRIGDFFKKRCSDSWGYVFTGNMNLAKRIGLKTKRRIEFYTAQIECRLLEFELYAGSRKGLPASPAE
jgi:23S rRNA G2445 N2-methylase RlmL